MSSDCAPCNTAPTLQMLRRPDMRPDTQELLNLPPEHLHQLSSILARKPPRLSRTGRTHWRRNGRTGSRSTHHPLPVDPLQTKHAPILLQAIFHPDLLYLELSSKIVLHSVL
ncbi:hypothetical protein PtB15_18B436 [Puccinia triticina]|nr:hypothetical protein PtB15_18B436 [Puccinia triticina]